MKRLILACLGVMIGFNPIHTFAEVFHVGPTQKMKRVSDVPWEALRAGDQVLIDWRPEPYKEKFVLCCNGTDTAPIVVRGVPGPKQQLPVIDGSGATTRSFLKYWGDVRGTVKIGGAIVPKGLGADYVTIENLEIRGARPPYTFTDSGGQTKGYTVVSAALYVEKAHHLTVRNCTLTDSSQGLFVSSNDQSASSDIMVERCHFYNNGAGLHGHSIYTEAIGITFQYNHLGPLRTNCAGNNLKDRSAGLVVRYNWIEGGDKQLDLVDAEDSALVRKSSAYRKAFVYGNVFIKDEHRSHPQLVHYGGDSGRIELYRKGTLYFYNNTVVIDRKDPIFLFWLATQEEACDFRNNIVSCVGGKVFGLNGDRGTLRLSRNFLPESWQQQTTAGKMTIVDDRTTVRGTDPGFIDRNSQLFQLRPTSPCRDTATKLAHDCLPANVPSEEYLKHQSFKKRFDDGRMDIGAFEYKR